MNEETLSQDELLKNSKCSKCKEGVMHTGLPLFWRIKIDRFGIDSKAVQRQAGLEMMIGNAQIAKVISPETEFAKTIMETKTVILCEQCAYADDIIGLMAFIEED